MSSWTGKASSVSLGPGHLWVGSLSATDPTDATTPLDASEDDGADGKWVPIGYTDQGATFTYNVTSEPVEVAEELEEIARRRVRAETSIAFAMAETTARNLVLALNGGLVANPTSIEPIDADEEQRVKLIHETVTGARWLFRKAYNTGGIEIQNQKAPAKRLIPVTFSIEKPDVGKPWVVFPSETGALV